jgi:cell division protease FtsH
MHSKKTKPDELSTGKLSVFLVFLMMLFLVLSEWNIKPINPLILRYSELLNLAEQRRLTQLRIDQDWIEGDALMIPYREPQSFRTSRVEDTQLIDRLHRSQVSFQGVSSHGLKGLFHALVWLFPIALLMSFWVFLSRRVGTQGHPKGFMSLTQSKARLYSETDLMTRFSDVAGVEEAKEELKDIVKFLRHPHQYSILGAKMPKGILLVGPPGTGKTLLAKAVAGEARVPFFSINGSEFVEMFVGLGAARVRDLFAHARESAPAIVFIDELDALGKSRALSMTSGGPHEEKEQTLNQLLAELDGFDSSDGVILLAATNRPEILDPALLRAGRFDRRILVDRPDRKGRQDILGVHLRKVKTSSSIDITGIAAMTTGFSGADLANLVNEATLEATRRNAPFVEDSHLMVAFERVVAGVERKTRILSMKERTTVAYHEMGHATVALALGQNEVIHKVSIIPRGLGSLGYTMSRPTEDLYLMGKKDLETKLAVALGGRVAEEIFLTDISTGARDDLEKATEIAKTMVTLYGMSKDLGVGVYSEYSDSMLGGHSSLRKLDYSETTAREIDLAVRQILCNALSRAEGVIRVHSHLVEEGVTLLMKDEIIGEKDLIKLWKEHKSKT